MNHNSPASSNILSNGQLDILTNSVVDLISNGFREAVRLIWGDNLTEYVAASDARRHVWHSWLAGHSHSEVGSHMRDYLRFSKSRDIIYDAFGSCPSGYLPATKRLGPIAREPEFYLTLFQLLSRGGQIAKLIQHSTELDSDVIDSLTSIPNDPFSTEIFSILFRASVGVDRYCAAVWLAQSLRKVFGDQEIIRTLGGSSNPMKALLEMLVQMPFPEGPLACCAPLFALKSADEIEAVSKEFGNCLKEIDSRSEMILNIQAGRRYLYRWAGDEPALIQLGRFGSSGWVIEEAWGVCNRRLSPQTQKQIEAIFASEPSICIAWPSWQSLPTYGWFFDYL